MKSLQNNKDLYEFLRTLSQELNARGATDLGAIVSGPLSYYSAAVTAEFAYETRATLWKLLKEQKDRLLPQERADMEDAVQQINDAIDRRH